MKGKSVEHLEEPDAALMLRDKQIVWMQWWAYKLSAPLGVQFSHGGFWIRKNRQRKKV